MKTLWKVLKICLIVFVSFVLVLVVAGWALQDQITKLALKKVSETVGAPLDIENVSLSLISDFPMATVCFENIWMGSDSTDVQGNVVAVDTLLKFEKIYVSVESEPLLDNVFNIRKVEVENGFVKYEVDAKGVGSYDFLMSTDTTAVVVEDTTNADAPILLSLDEFTLSNVKCFYRDDTLGAKATVAIPELVISARMDSVSTYATVRGAASISGLAYEGSNAHELRQADFGFDLVYDTDSIFLKKFQVNTDELEMKLDGKVGLASELYVSLNTALEIGDIENLVKYAPRELLDEYEISGLTGRMNLLAKVSGVVGDSLLPHADLDFVFTNGGVKYGDYPAIRGLELQLFATNGSLNANSTTAVDLKQLSFDFGGNLVQLSGKFSNLDRLRYVIQSKMKLNLATLKPLLPPGTLADLGGSLNAQFSTNGTLPDSIDDQFIEKALHASRLNLQMSKIKVSMDSVITAQGISGTFSYNKKAIALQDFVIDLPEYDVSLDQSSIEASWKGNVMKPESLSIDIPTFYLSASGQTIKGKAKVVNPMKPTFELDTEIGLVLADLMRYAPDTLVRDLIGKIDMKISTSGSIDLETMDDAQIEDILYNRTAFETRLSEVSLNMVDTMMSVSNLSGKVVVKDQVIALDNFKGLYSGIDFNVEKTVVKNLFSTVLADQPGTLQVEGVYRLGHLDYAMLDAFMATDTTAVQEPEEQSTEETAPSVWDYEIKGRFYVDSFLYGKALIEDISGKFNVKDTVYVVDELAYKAFGGSGESSMKIIMSGDQMEIQMKNVADKLDVRRVMKEMDDFDMTELISYKNLDGLASTEGLYLQLKFIGDSLIYEDMRMSGDFSYLNGGIYNYEAMKDMEALPGMKNLDTLLIKPINNKEIFIFKNDLAIPKIYMITNKFDTEFSAKQSFGDDFKYLISYNLGQFAVGKSKKRLEKQEAKGDEASDKRDDQTFQHILTSVKNGKFKLDFFVSEKERSKMGREIKVIRANNKVQFHPEYFEFETGVN